MKNRIAALFVVCALAGLSGCNTMEGFGKDVAKVGTKIEQKADQHK